MACAGRPLAWPLFLVLPAALALAQPSAQPADLAVNDVRVAGDLCLGSPLTFTAWVVNLGQMDPGPFQVQALIDGLPYESLSVPFLRPGTASRLEFSPLPAQAGTHTVQVVADPGAQVPETNETNNGRAITFAVPRQEPTTLAIEAPDSIAVGTPVTVRLSLQASSGVPVPAQAVDLRLVGTNRTATIVTGADGTATASISPEAVGNHTLAASFSGSCEWAAATTQQALRVRPVRVAVSWDPRLDGGVSASVLTGNVSVIRRADGVDLVVATVNASATLGFQSPFPIGSTLRAVFQAWLDTASGVLASGENPWPLPLARDANYTLDALLEYYWGNATTRDGQGLPWTGGPWVPVNPVTDEPEFPPTVPIEEGVQARLVEVLDPDPAGTEFQPVYVTEVLLTVVSDHGTVFGGGWYERGSVATWRVDPASVPADDWSGQIGADLVAVPSVGTTVMDAPQTVTVAWELRPGDAAWLVGGAVGICGSLYLTGGRREDDELRKSRGFDKRGPDGPEPVEPDGGGGDGAQWT